MAFKKPDVYQLITDRIVAQLESGVNPWRRPWISTSGEHRNFVTKRPYRGINQLVTMMSGFHSPYWVTFNQAKTLGGNVRKGEKGTPIVYWNFFERENKTDADKTDRIPFIKYFTVFNVQQCDGLTVPEPTALHDVPVDERAETAVASWLDKPRIDHGGDRAFYAPFFDTVTLPPRHAFENAAGYYGTLFHELVHATGAATRLDRFKPNEGQFVFGSESYSAEELVAELGSTFIAARLGLSLDEQNNVAYLRGWLKKLRGDKKFIFHAARDAQKATDMILGAAVEAEEQDEPATEAVAL